MALMFAVLNGHPECVSILIESGVDVNALVRMEGYALLILENGRRKYLQYVGFIGVRGNYWINCVPFCNR